MMDFPWNAWAHKDADRDAMLGSGELYLYSTPAAGLAGIRVSCAKCNASNSMAGAFRQNALAEIYGTNVLANGRGWAPKRSKRAAATTADYPARRFERIFRQGCQFDSDSALLGADTTDVGPSRCLE